MTARQDMEQATLVTNVSDDRRAVNKHQEKTARTRAALVSAFCELYRKKPIEEIAVKEIVAIAGCNRTTFYQHFKSTYELLETLEAKAIEAVACSMASLPPDDGAVDAFPQAFLALCGENRKLFVLLLKGSCAQRFRSRLAAAARPYVIRNLRLGDACDDRAAGYLADFYLAGSIAVASSCIGSSDEGSLSDAGFVLNGALTEGIVGTAGLIAARASLNRQRNQCPSTSGINGEKE